MGKITTALKNFATELRSSGDPLGNPAIPLSSSGFWAWAIGGEPTASGESVSISTALQQATVYACVRVLSESVASLPVKVYELIDKGRKESTNHDLAQLLGVSPNPEMTAFTFWESMVGALALTGNCYAEIQRDASQTAVALWPLHPQLTEPKRTARTADGKGGGDLVYETTDGMDGTGKSRTIASANMIHVPLFSFDGVKGLSPISLARQGIGLARAAEKQGARFFGNGARPSGVLSTITEFETDDPALQAARDSWNRTQGGDKQGSTAVLPGDWKYTPISISNKDSQFLEIRQYQRTEIAALFRVPPHMVGDTSKMSNANAEQQALMYVVDTLRPYLGRIEGEVARKLLPTNGRNAGKFQVEFDISERLRGDITSQSAGFTAGRQGGWFSVNDIRRKLGENPIGEVGDAYIVAVNYQNAERLLDTESLQDQPLALTAGDPTEPVDPATDPAPTAEERSVLAKYTSAYLLVYRDAFGRLIKRDKRDFEAITALFSPVLRSIAGAAQDAAMTKNGLSVMPSGGIDKHVEAVCRSMAKRCADGVVDIPADEDSLAGSEFSKAVRSLVINAARDAAAFAAEQSVNAA